MIGKIVILLQLILFCALFTLMVKLAVGKSALNGLYFCPKPVQEYDGLVIDRLWVGHSRFWIIMIIGWRNQSRIRLISLPNDKFGSE